MTTRITFFSLGGCRLKRLALPCLRDKSIKPLRETSAPFKMLKNRSDAFTFKYKTFKHAIFSLKE